VPSHVITFVRFSASSGLEQGELYTLLSNLQEGSKSEWSELKAFDIPFPIRPRQKVGPIGDGSSQI
jgi:hypothetical protein